MTITPDLDTGDIHTRIGHPRPARTGEPFLVGDSGAFPLVADAPTAHIFRRPEQVKRKRMPTFLVVLAFLTVSGAVGYQAWQVHRLDNRLDAAQRTAAEAVAAGDQRAAELEERINKAFDSEAVSASVLPSVFRVRAGNFTGTAFAVGDPVKGGANLITNFHVVEELWNGGGREVTLERGSSKVTAKIVTVDRDIDIAQLRTEKQIAGLAVATAAVRPGQQIVVAGAPLGLDDTVTTGVVSAIRDGDGQNQPMVQFDAPINPGNSGGPVVNANREVVGIATAKARGAEGIGLAIPIMAACVKVDAC